MKTTGKDTNLTKPPKTIIQAKVDRLIAEAIQFEHDKQIGEDGKFPKGYLFKNEVAGKLFNDMFYQNVALLKAQKDWKEERTQLKNEIKALKNKPQSANFKKWIPWVVVAIIGFFFLREKAKNSNYE